MQCAWCFEQERPHRFLTKRCAFFANANQMEKWKVIYKHQVCSKCFETGHHCKTCSTSRPACFTCHTLHHENLGCRSRETISLNHSRDWQLNAGRQKYALGTIFRVSLYRRTCPAQLTYPKKGLTTEGLTILYDQASITMIDPSLVISLYIETSYMKHTNFFTTTIQGTSYPEPCTIVDGLIVSALKGSNPVDLPELTYTNVYPMP